MKSLGGIAAVGALVVGAFFLGTCHGGEDQSEEVQRLERELETSDSLLNAVQEAANRQIEELEDSIFNVEGRLTRATAQSEQRVAELEDRAEVLRGQISEMVSPEAMAAIDQALGAKDSIISEEREQKRLLVIAREDDHRLFRRIIEEKDSIISGHEAKDRIQEALIEQLRRENEEGFLEKAEEWGGRVGMAYTIIDVGVKVLGS